MGKFVLSTGANGDTYFNLKAGNGEVILSSQGYASRDGARSGIASVQKNASQDDHYERKTAANGSAFFVLKAGNGEIIGKSEMYTSTSAMENGIASVKKNAPSAGIEDAM